MMLNVCFAQLLFGVAATALAVGLPPNGGFEGGFGPDGLAEQWADNSSWADLDVTYSRGTVNSHSGQSCQEITCDRLESGAVQMIAVKGIPLRKGKIYRVRAWLRGDSVPVAVQLRLTPAPYTVYIERHLTPTPKWQKLEYFWTSNVNNPESRLMFRFAETGAIWVDDVSVAEVAVEDALATVAPPVAGNLLHNGDFRLGLANWMINHGCDDWEQTELTIESTASGPILKAVIPPRRHVTIGSDAVAVAQGHAVAISCRMKASRPVSVDFTSNHCGKRINVGREWQTFDTAGKARFQPVSHGVVHCRAKGPVTLWVDSVQLRQDGKREGERPRAAIICSRHPNSLYTDSEEPVLRLLRSSATPLSADWQVEDFWGEIVRSGTCAPSTGNDEQRISCAELPRGWYRASVSWGKGSNAERNESVFAVLPGPQRTGDIQTCPFGAHFPVDPAGLNLARAVGVRWLRLHPPNHTKWRVVQPNEGNWQWRDEPIKIARKAGLELCGSLDRCPTWASSAPPDTPDYSFYTGTGAWLPRNWGEWELYVRETVRRHRGDIHRWEIWNEPNLTSWLIPREGQTRAQAYVEMLKHTTPVIRREVPEAVIVGGCVAGAMTETSEARTFAFDIIDLGALQLMDVFSFHQYIRRSVDEGDEPIDVWLPKLRRKMRSAGRELAIINSEGGYADPGTSIRYRPCPQDTVPPQKMARWLVRQYVAQMALGVQRFYFYNFFIDGSAVVRRWEGFLEGDGQPLPNVAAFATMTWLLDGATYLGTERPTPDTWIHTFATPSGRLAVAWSRTDTTAVLPFPNMKQAWDLMGAEIQDTDRRVLTITDAPNYILMGAGQGG
ncbi:MAG: hypothetical protein HN742_32670 [Lentisphaerae bacterium]|jgi:hypothetical protein|nr:hypothetical protein [Lentisphaerota bacterium]MBT4822754.1 hypothetical protein [Lentisphaerota bacterium]MBT5605827.1 hypothetical protein [Lentisphaerota bacterium]MBT7055630.1 hypothetical protein [Lentisphaerota bacterium]MBT7846670.1 hypothetical protein [Lentisphaerota bacterium]